MLDEKEMGKNELANYQNAQAFMNIEDGIPLELSEEEKESPFIVPLSTMFAITMLEEVEIYEEVI